MQAPARVHQRAPGAGLGVGLEQLALGVLQRVGQVAAQVQVAVDHGIEHAQHQVVRALRHAVAGARAVHAQPRVVGLALQEADRRLAARRVHADQQAVEDGKADGARIDALERLGRARTRRAGAMVVAVALSVGLDLGQRGQAPENHQVIDRGGVVARGVGGVGQVLRVHVQQRRATQALRGVLQLGQALREVGAVEVDPDKAVGRRRRGHGVGKAQAAGGEFDDVHVSALVVLVKMAFGACLAIASSYLFRSMRAASRAK